MGNKLINFFSVLTNTHQQPAHISYFHRFSYNTWFEGFLAIPGATGFLQYLVGGGEAIPGTADFLAMGECNGLARFNQSDQFSRLGK